MKRDVSFMNEDILRNIGTIARALDSISNIEFKKIQLEKGQYLYLSRIFENPGITQREISELLCVDKTTTNRAITRLIEKKLVIKKDDPSNQKNKLLFATLTGEKLYTTLRKESDYSTKIALTGLSVTEAEELNYLLLKMTKNVVNNWNEVKKGYKRVY
ncbi:hypothetical protein FC92_GL001775 [Liquorilactobacillus hordei DSM 19519]|uniref:HTH marR-type domain-containing protein n=2 Tax=Liquorilactobacillus hordei TaxID=468911 RepID=A0A0R1MJQ3_9LACO|nr:hypothetical protein FC92_GL001775 [Liquorilactobacillus hordei DSM 19519]